jgi:aspartate-semialdehyde dehydrogenase
MSKKQNLAIIGATGLVGEEFIKILREENLLDQFEVLKFRRTRNPHEGEWSLEEDFSKLAECKFIFNAASSDAAKAVGEKLADGQYLIDNSSAYRMHKEVPLVVPEVNGNLIRMGQKIFANPNCTAGILCTALNPLRPYGIKQLFVSTYQAASGAGKDGLAELRSQLAADKSETVNSAIFGYRLGGNVISHNSAVRDDSQEVAGFNEEEFKVMEETRKILDLPGLPIAVTCIRVPVERAHTESVVVDLEKDMTIAQMRELYTSQPGLIKVDEPKKNYFPMPLEADGKREVLVGRFRKDPLVPKRFLMMLSGDQLLKGAAWNAFQIFQQLTKLKD